jgi:hypothetical protein
LKTTRPTRMSVSKLDFDEDNSRFDEGAVVGQKAALAELMRLGGREIVAMARHIARVGGLNPGENLIIVARNGRHAVLEGNRRLAALRQLSNPSLAPAEFRPAFKRLRESYEPIKKVFIVEADDEAEAYEWIKLKHTGPNGGVGVDPWNSAAKARADEKHTGKVSTFSALLKVLEGWYPPETPLGESLDDIRYGEHYTDLERILDDASVRRRLGFDIKQGRVTGRYSADQLRPFFEHLFSEIAADRAGQPAWSRVWSRTADRQKWIADLGTVNPSAAPPSETDKTTPTVLLEGSQPGARSEGAGEARKNTARQQPRKTRVISKQLDSSGFVPSAEYALGVRQLFEELTTIPYDKYPNMTLDATRSLLEKAIKNYALLQGEKIQPAKAGNRNIMLGDCLSWLREHYKLHPTKEQLKDAVNSLQNSVNRDGLPAPLRHLNTANHNPNVVASPEQVKEIWEAGHAVLQDILNRGPERP